MNNRHRRVAKLKVQEEKRLKAKYARVIRKLFPQLEPKLVAIAEGIAKIGKAMCK